MRLYIPDIDLSDVAPKTLFILTRPFLLGQSWGNDAEVKVRWGIADGFSYTAELDKADVYLLPLPVQRYAKAVLQEMDRICERYAIRGYGYVSGDFGEDLGCYPNLVFFRMGGFKSQLSTQNKGFPVTLSDHYQGIYKEGQITPRPKLEKPVVGFCGHASFDTLKKWKTLLMFSKVNLLRFLKAPLRKDYEAMFPSALYRAQLLQTLGESSKITTNFILREAYRAGATTKAEREQTTLEYYDNINTSDYVLCVRGAGNFSVRLYETLMMGRIPIFVNTDCLLPFEDVIDWKQHVVWVEWEDRDKIVEKVLLFHEQHTAASFEALQLANRRLWKDSLSLNSILSQMGEKS